MYLSEQVFVDKFLATLTLQGYNSIPFGNEDFKRGIYNMHSYYNQNKDEMGKYRGELSMLFLQQPLGGEYFEFEKLIGDLNGSILSFENPSYITVDIKLDTDNARELLDYEDIDIGIEHISEFARLFCEGANLIPSE